MIDIEYLAKSKCFALKNSSVSSRCEVYLFKFVVLNGCIMYEGYVHGTGIIVSNKLDGLADGKICLFEKKSGKVLFDGCNNEFVKSRFYKVVKPVRILIAVSRIDGKTQLCRIYFRGQTMKEWELLDKRKILQCTVHIREYKEVVRGGHKFHIPSFILLKSTESEENTSRLLWKRFYDAIKDC